jgi:hypothetical protein
MTKCLPDEKRNCLLREETREVRLGCANFCVTGMMSRCSAGTAWNDQQRCAEAQRELRNAVKIKADKP